MKNTRFWFLLMANLLALSGLAHAYREIIDLGTLSGFSQSCAYSVNDNGQIVGYIRNNTTDYRACFFDSTGGENNRNLGTLGSIRGRSVAYCINNNGQVVGYAGNTTGAVHACLFDLSGTNSSTDLGPPKAGMYGTAFSINDSGEIVGGMGSSETYFRASSFDIADVENSVYLGGLGGDFSQAMSINNNGQVAGYAHISGYQVYHACLFDIGGSGNNIDLGGLGGTGIYESYARSINDNGQITGFAWHKLGPDQIYMRACLFDSTGAGNNIDLGTLGGHASWAYAINSSNQIVGQAYINSDIRHACLFDPTGTGNNIDLNSFIDPSLGWELKIAYDINNKGWIVGQGVNADGELHAYLLIPEPISIFFLALGGWFIRGKRF